MSEELQTVGADESPRAVQSPATRRIGFMQGRLSPALDGRLQAFPWPCWRDEFAVAERYGYRLMEWTADQDRLYESPLLTSAGQNEIRARCDGHGLTIPSLTGDCFMQAPFWQVEGSEREVRTRHFRQVAKACVTVGISLIVVPLVDHGRLKSREQENVLVAVMSGEAKFLTEHGLRVVFESDFPPWELARFIGRLDPAVFGVNYDIGNSASLGFDPAEEMAAYGSRLLNVHVKDRARRGTSVPLGTGSANFDAVFAGLGAIGYTGNYVLQTARATDGDDAGVLCRYRDMTVEWIDRHGA